MAKMHPSMERFYAAARQIDPAYVRQVDLANALNESSQTVNNWESRGVSKDGALAAQRRLGVSATYLLDGQEPALLSQSQPARITEAMMANAWHLAKVMAANTTGSPEVKMPRDSALLAQALLAALELKQEGESDGERAGTIGGSSQPQGATPAREESKPARGRRRKHAA